ncbi:EXS-domain-containing protein [Aaosphaeria arxii CBS 175.79]|uniref:EXS-domain-containing protein n=1 Tax=Aaosphaeria arxii CBS 175.79 TaxID=1450172 RepID=A0A6A5Y6N7_9PLEO|nr:EXS-domain-containing protein [Aaosphaeria arxii CBS 175.79]KAF2021225.1 EXS-domain-containing protein [Aaosphaeria arxii CBS 175.79]
MDWSLGDPYARHPFLRDTLGYKKVWMYYAAMVVDPILRFNWIFYAIIPLQLQHSAITSFAVALSEVCRRGMWTLFRVENEHSTNVGRFRASRDVPLPYDLSTPSPEVSIHEPGSRPASQQAEISSPMPPPRTPVTPGIMPERTQTVEDGDVEFGQAQAAARRRDQESTDSPIARGLSRVGTILRSAHVQDFEKKRKPELGARGTAKIDDDDTDDDDDEEANHSGSASRGGSDSGDAQAERQNERDIAEVRRDVDIGRAGEGSSSNGAAV